MQTTCSPAIFVYHRVNDLFQCTGGQGSDSAHLLQQCNPPRFLGFVSLHNVHVLHHLLLQLIVLGFELIAGRQQ